MKAYRIACMAAVLCAAVGSAVLAANTEPRIGVVDLDRVYREAPRVRQFEDEITALDRLLTAKLDIRSQNLMLTEAELTELTDLKTKPKPTAADNARIKQLTDIERARGDELTTLQGTKDLNAQQQARLKELQGGQRKSKDTGVALIKDYRAQLESKEGEVREKEDTEVRAAVKKVGEARGFTLVLDKGCVLMGGTDLTADVISRLDPVK